MLKDRVKVITSTTGTGVITLGNAYTGYQDFTVMPTGNTYYAITSGSNWEIGLGYYSGGLLTRDEILDSSNGGNHLDLTTTSTVFVTYPAAKSIYLSSSAQRSSGDFLIADSEGWNSRPLASSDITAALGYSPGSGNGASYTANSGILLESNNFRIGGTGNLKQLTFDNNAILIGTSSSAHIYDVTLGYQAGALAKTSTDPYDTNISIGYQAGRTSSGNNTALTCIGTYSGKDIISGNYSTIIGDGAGWKAGTISSAVVIGDYAGYQAGYVIWSTLIGQGAGDSSIYIKNGICIGASAGAGASGESNILIGEQVGGALRGNNNIFIGRKEGIIVSGSSYNVFIGNTYSPRYMSGSGNLLIEPSGGTNHATTVFDGTAAMHKMSIGDTIVGDMAGKKIAIGNVTSAQLNPASTLEIIPKLNTDIGFIVKGATSQTANLAEFRNSTSTILASVDYLGSISGLDLNVRSGILIQSGVPASTANKLYAVGTSLYWNGSGIASSIGGDFATLGNNNFTGVQNLQLNKIQNVNIQSYAETIYNTSILNSGLTLNLASGNIFNVLLDSNITGINIQPNFASGNAQSFTLILDYVATGKSITWPSNVYWNGGSGEAPVIVSGVGRSAIFSFMTPNSGNKYFGFIGGTNFGV